MDINLSFLLSKIPSSKQKTKYDKESGMRNKSFHIDNEIKGLAMLWMLPAIFRAGGEREFLRCRYDHVLEFLGVRSSEPTKQDIEVLKNRLDILEKNQNLMQTKRPRAQLKFASIKFRSKRYGKRYFEIRHYYV